MFKPIDTNSWKRKPYFDHYFNQIRCTYSITINIDITNVLSFKDRNKVKLYPLLIYVISKAVNKYEEFRTAINDRGEIGVWETLSPCYTVFHKDSESFSNIWTEWNDDLNLFLSNFEQDSKRFGQIDRIDAKPNTPANVFPISSLPWTTFTGFNLNIFADGTYLLPIFTYGKYFKDGDRYLIPLSIQVHHAVCDGFHVSRLINEIQQECSNMALK
ncbi:type A chloramphenicol O-acetyltransferase [uncultured Alistipes sp.]|uniref:type A chloramphenicol O-acetyltransferase n=1 Tax=uncultured Alistipes sp. TaxID=538949 RepID=UPI000E9745D7|nr:type A chloramphenicol O-acetyltransferase [uncultured Alistipes sp.]HBL70586.1 type A chloramphenicol O-acetyltransferase [Alistipes sp.]HBW00793.1 type A chloramphenicol O-acetyltransferase [Alistipes sp.]